MPTDPHAAEYRRRAATLRRMADRLDASPLHSLQQWAGPDTWTSPAADECRVELSTDQARFRTAADDVRHQAWQFERHADSLDAAAVVAAAAMTVR